MEYARCRQNHSTTAGRCGDVNGDQHLTPLDALLVVNTINKYADPLNISINLDQLSDRNQNSVALKSRVNYVGQSLPDVKVEIRSVPGLTVLAEGRADATGKVQIVLDSNAPLNHLRFLVSDDRGRTNQTERLLRTGDVLLDWNSAILDVVRETTVESATVPGLLVKPPPPLVARNMAMIHIAMFDAVNAIDRSFVGYVFDGANLPTSSTDASIVAAAASAAHRVASALYSKPHDLAIWDSTLAASLEQVPDGPAKTAGLEIGGMAAEAIMAERTNDGATAPASYVPGTQAGQWRPTPPDNAGAVLPQWPNVAPFAMASGSQFRPAPPPTLDSAQYAAALDEVFRLGVKQNSSRTADQTAIAAFWADGGGTATPPGHWNQIAADLALQRGNSTVVNARLFAMLNVALADAAIASWDAKYAHNMWRPISAIRSAGEDGNPATVPDTTWLPLLATPAFPSYTSGHSTFSGAAATVLAELFGSSVAFSTYADRGSLGAWPPPDDISLLAKRSFNSFESAAQEAGISRIYGGIHFQFDNTAGLSAGRGIGELVINQFFKPRPAN